MGKNKIQGVRLVNLGDEVKDRVTGLKGIITSYSENLFGCDRVFIQPPVGKDGKTIDGWWVDTMSAKVLEAGKVKGHKALNAADNGGPMSRLR